MKAKRFNRIVIICILILGVFATNFCFADDIQASSLIYHRGADAKVISNGIKISFEIIGKSVLTDIGAATIYIKSTSGITVKTYSYTSYSNMMGHNSQSHISSVTYTGGITNHQYYAVVTFRASNSSGSETKTSTTNTVTAP